MDIKVLKRQMRSNCHYLPKLVITCMGLSANETNSKLYKLYAWIIQFLVALYPMTCAHLMFSNMNNYNIVIAAIFNVVGGIASVFKTFVIKKNRRGLKKIFDDIEMLQVQKNIKGWGQVECYKMNKMMLAVIIIFYSFLFALYIGTMLARIIVKDPNKWIMPIIEFSLFDTTYSPNFEIAWFYHTVATLGCSSIYCFADFLIAGLIIDLTTQYTVLTETIKIQFKSTCSEKRSSLWYLLNLNIFFTLCQSLLVGFPASGFDLTAYTPYVRTSSENKEPSYEDLKAFIGSVVSHHTSLIQLTTEVNSACADLLLITVMASLVTVSSAMYYATVVPMQSTAAVLSIFEMLAVITSMFVLSYFGTQLSTASQNVANACYELDFIGLDVRFQKSLLMIIMRCQRPAWLSVGGFTNLSIAVFTWMMRSTYSYFMILRKNQQVKDGTMQST